MIHKTSPVAKKIQQLLSLESKKSGHGMMPVYEENGVYNFYLKLGQGGSVAGVEEKKVESMTRDELLVIVQTIQRASGGGQQAKP